MKIKIESIFAVTLSLLMTTSLTTPIRAEEPVLENPTQENPTIDDSNVETPIVENPINNNQETEQQTEIIQENTIKIGEKAFDTLHEAINSANIATISLTGEFSLDSVAVINKNQDIVIEGGTIKISGANSFVISGKLTLKNVVIEAEMDPGKAPISLVEDNACFESTNMTLTQTGESAMGYVKSQQAIQIDKDGKGNTSPAAIEIILNDSHIQMDGDGARAICFASTSEGTKISINNSSILNGTNSLNEWKGGQSRAIGLFDTKDVTVDIADSQLSGWQYVINSGGNQSLGLSQDNLIINVDHSILCGWTGFNIWTRASVINIENDSHILGLNGKFNGDKIYSFATIVINDDIYDYGWGTATNTYIKIMDSTIEAQTLDDMPEECLIRIDNANNFKLEILGDSILKNNVENMEWPFVLYNKRMENEEENEKFITEKIEVEPTVQMIGNFGGFARDLSEKIYQIELKLESDQTMGTARVAEQFKNKLIENEGFVEIIASAKSGYKFAGWFDTNNSLISSDATTLVKNSDYDKLIAKFEADYVSVPPESTTSGKTESGDKIKVTEVRTSKETASALGKENVLTSIEIKEVITTSVSVTLDAGRKNAEKTVYVVQTNPITNKFELVAVSIADKKGTIEFSTQSNEVLTLTTQLPSGFISTVDTPSTQSETYYINEEHQFQKGWLELEEGWHFFDYKSAAQKAEGWVWSDENSAYYVNAQGVMEVGPKYIDGWYIDRKGTWNRDLVVN